MAFITEGRVCHTVSTATVHPCSDQISFFLVSGNSCFRILVHLFATGRFNRNVSEMDTDSAATAFVEIKNNFHHLLSSTSTRTLLVSMAFLLVWPKISSLRDLNLRSPSSSQSVAATFVYVTSKQNQELSREGSVDCLSVKYTLPFPIT